MDPKVSLEVDKRGDKKTLELALRIVWARHSVYRKERGDKNPHEAKVIEEITIESAEEIEGEKSV